MENAQVAIKIWVRLDKPKNVWNYSEVLTEVAQNGAAAAGGEGDFDI